ncbi:peptide/nickel transport system substrate-binding protein [Alicyclobacillus hesperidum]|uniref:Peptide/nickel transport system substrate-binding protein n=1 Tax=Alicyclobacillus hesperidum TaxID=89784 RepID=A0A1H2R5W8_9BACL|nr:peptide ABC transporter substrate-binding protein [Alicyclobacillus hesperidum]SDW14715.1 peptide/nickel transport system substrate-binding protein [Alicyclobacillus hesperidum]
MVQKKKRVLMSAAAAAAVVLGVAGCGTTGASSASGNSTPANQSATNTATTGAASTATGGVIEFALPPATNLTWFLPIFNAANDSLYNSQLVDQLYIPMLQLNNDYSINWNNSIAQKITYNKQGTVYHIFINPKWKWSNGQPVTSKDVLFTWNVIKAASAKNAPAPWPFVGVGTGDIPDGIKSVQATGKYEVTITLKQPANQQWFEYNGIVQLTPLPASYMDVKSNIEDEIKYLGANATNLMFDKVVDGPFKPVSAKSSQDWVIAPNPSYAGHKSTVSKIVFQYEGSNAAEFAALRSGQINVGYLDQSQLGSESALTSLGDSITPEYPFGIFWTEMNMYSGAPHASVFDQLYVRQALQMSIDNNTIAKSIYKGFAEPLSGPIPGTPRTQFYDPAENNLYPYNPTKAKQLLESHGWKLVNGVMTKGNQKLNLTLMYVTGNQSSLDAAELMQQDWAQIGVKVSLKGEEFMTFLSKTSNPKDYTWDLATGSGWVYNGPGFYPSGEGLFNTGAPSGTGYSDKEEDALINATHVPYATQQETMQHFYQYEMYTAKQLPFLWGVNVATLAVVAPNVHNVLPYYNGATGVPEMQYWTVSNK